MWFNPVGHELGLWHSCDFVCGRILRICWLLSVSGMSDAFWLRYQIISMARVSLERM